MLHFATQRRQPLPACILLHEAPSSRHSASSLQGPALGLLGPAQGLLGPSPVGPQLELPESRLAAGPRPPARGPRAPSAAADTRGCKLRRAWDRAHRSGTQPRARYCRRRLGQLAPSLGRWCCTTPPAVRSTSASGSQDGHSWVLAAPASAQPWEDLLEEKRHYQILVVLCGDVAALLMTCKARSYSRCCNSISHHSHHNDARSSIVR